MSTIEKNRNRPPVIPTDSEFWDFHEREFRPLQVEQYPKDHLVGRVTLEDCVAAAEDRYEQGLPLSSTEKDLLKLSQELAEGIYDEPWPTNT